MTAAMKRLSLFLPVAALCLAAALSAQERRGRGEGGPDGRGGATYANPSAAIAAELALARDSRERGQWPALAAAAAPEAVLFVPQAVWAQTWLKGRAGGPAGATRVPHEVWSSCDGSLVASRGAWQRGAQGGRYTTLWQRQPGGGYRWLVAEETALNAPLAAPDMIAAHLADCPERPRRTEGPPPQGRKPEAPRPVKAKAPPAPDPGGSKGSAADGSLQWALSVSETGRRRLVISWRHEGREEAIIDEVTGTP